MKDINHVTLVGRLTRDAELRYTNSGLQICKFSVAVNTSKKSGDSWTDEANFFDVVLMGRQAESVHRFLKKGKQVGVDGELRHDRWEQDGQKRSRVEIFAQFVQLLGGGGSGGGAPGGGSSERSDEGSSYDAPVAEPDRFEDDVPF
ncbi:MAG: single-stranded DNA-binding protein [Spirochaetaceae bacterium]|nr:MAG: single-stranded DNA-binding protein [Spirochaetaceae bacterium]